MKPDEAMRVCEKIVAWLPRREHDKRVALETLIGLVKLAIAEVERERAAAEAELRDELAELGGFARYLDQLEEAS